MIRLSETHVDEIVTALEADLPSRVVAIAAAAPVTAMAAVASISHGAKRNAPLPSIEVIPDASRVEHDGMDELTFRHRIAVVIRAAHQNEETLERILQRYAAAVIQTCMDKRAARTWEGFTFQLVTEDGGDLEWGPVLGDDRGNYQGDVLIRVIANADDERT